MLIQQQYQSFKARMKQIDSDDNALLLDMWHLQSFIDLPAHQEYLLYWPKDNPASFVGLAHTCLDASKCSKATSNLNLFMIVPVSLVKKHLKHAPGQPIFTNCTSSNDEDYCYLTHRKYDTEEWLPLAFITMLYNGIQSLNGRRKRRPSTVENIPVAQKSISYHPCILFNELYMSDNLTTRYGEQLFSEYDAAIVSNFSSYYDNTDFKQGYTFSGPLNGPFCIKMNRIHGIIGVSATTTGTYKLLVSSRRVTIAVDTTNKEVVRPRAHERMTRISVLNSGRTGATTRTHEITYSRLDTAGGMPLTQVATGEEWCLVESNDCLMFCFGDDSSENTGFFALSNLNGSMAAACKFNVNYANIFMWYEDDVTCIPYRMQIELNEFMSCFYNNECRHKLMNVTLAASDIEDAKKKFANEWINSELDTHGSMEDHFSRINMLAHTKICETPHSRLPEFYILDKALAVNKLRATRSRIAEQDKEIPIITSKNGVCIEDWVRLDHVRMGGLFLFQKPLASFKVDLVQKLVTLSPIGIGQCYEIIEYIVY